jgi:uncharacterized protein YdhG (YjbR/CyaY superfamily)
VAEETKEAVDAYIGQFDAKTQDWLNFVRAIILDELGRSDPQVIQAISYQIVGFKALNKYLLYISGWKNHCSIHGQSKTLGEEFARRFPNDLRFKGTTLQFDPATLPNESLIREIVRRRVELFEQG